MQSQDVGAYWERNAAAWIELSRAGHDVYRDALNTPSFLEMLPPVSGLTGLDLGCGEGTNTRRVAALGAHMTAVDIAPSFIEAARVVEADDPLGIAFSVEDATNLPFPGGAFDFAVAFMSFMDMPDQAQALGEAHRVLVDGGFLQFSILHPCFVPPHRKSLKTENGETYAVQVAEYFRRTNGEVETWTFSSASPEELERHEPFQVPRFHRTLSDWIGMISAAGFRLEALNEPMADEEVAKAYPKVADTRVAPVFLQIRVRKLSGVAA